MLMLEEALAQVRTSMDEATSVLTIRNGNRELLGADASTENGRAAIEDFVHRLVPTLRGPPRLVRSRNGHFMDKPENVLSLINLATVRDLEQRWGTAIDPLRFRANLYIDGARPWEEFDWIGEDIAVGEAMLRVDRRNGRCGATNVNPATGRRDLDIPASLRAAFGHKDLGVYLVTKSGGRVAVGDRLQPPRAAAARTGLEARAALSRMDARRYICRGCYYVHDEAAGTAFADLPPDWRCPDCGTDRSNFRPHVGAPVKAAG
jgi:GntR family transcriptional regulator/MocR family aminotransferase